MDPSTDSFVELVKDALEHLYDPVRLREHPLIAALVPERLPLGVGPAQALRQVLLDGIERLNFSASLPPGARQNRAHQILVLRYVEALPFREAMAELSLSQPQFHREQRHALEALAALLQELAATSASSSPESPPDGEPEDSYADLDALLHRDEGPVDVEEIIRGVVRMLADVAAPAGVALRVGDSSTSPIALGNRTGLRQLVIGLVGYVLCASSSGELTLRAWEEDGIILQAHYRGLVDWQAFERAEARDRFVVVSRLVTALRGTISREPGARALDLSVRLPAARRTLLVIDDNAGAIQLVTRLLADQPYTVVGADDVRSGLTLARSARPDAILLDIMMPEQDGWDALQSLKHDPVAQDIPVLVCTVLAESRLALALGAAEFIRKPPTRPRLLEALARWTTVPRPPEGVSRGAPGSDRPGG
jgi:CheY-like chemotaxis protein